jgi:hypothetical protein
MREAFQKIKIENHVSAPDSLAPHHLSASLEPFSFIYNDEKLPILRQFTPCVVPPKKAYKNHLKQAINESERRTICAVNVDSFTDDQVTILSRKLVDALNRWPDIEKISRVSTNANFRLATRAYFWVQRLPQLANQSGCLHQF